MTCSKFEQSIYLWEEISPEEKAAVSKHMEACTTCVALFQQVQFLQEQVAEVSAKKTISPNAAQLTSRIMQGVHAQQRSYGIPVQVMTWVQENLLRYSLATMILIQIIFFGIEFQNKGNHAVGMDFPQSKAEVILNSKMIHHNPAERKNTSGFAACKTPFIERPAYLECLKSKYSSTLL